MNDYYFITYDFTDTWIDIDGIKNERRGVGNDIINKHPFDWLIEKNDYDCDEDDYVKYTLLWWKKLDSDERDWGKHIL